MLTKGINLQVLIISIEVRIVFCHRVPASGTLTMAFCQSIAFVRQILVPEPLL